MNDAHPLLGRRIVACRPMTIDEMVAEDWEMPSWSRPPATVLVLDDGTRLFPSCDHEGNGPGVLFGRDKDDRPFVIHYVK